MKSCVGQPLKMNYMIKS